MAQRIRLFTFLILWAMMVGIVAIFGVIIGTTLSIGLIGIVIAFGFGLLLARSAPDLFLPIMAATVVRAGLGIFQAVTMMLPDGAADALKFHRNGAHAASIPFAEWLANIPMGSVLYSHLLGLLYRPLGPNMLLGISLNVVLGISIVYVIARTTSRIWGNKISSRTAWICAFFPTLVLYSGVLLRENFIVLGLALSVLFAVLAVKRSSVALAVISVVMAYGAGLFNKGVWAVLPVPTVLVVGLILQWLAKKVGVRMTPTVKTIGLSVLAIVGLVAVYVGLEITGMLNKGFEEIQYAMEARTAGRTAYPDVLVPDRPIDLLWALPVRVLFFLLVPFPWMIRETVDLIGLADMLIYLIILIGLWASRKHLKNGPAVLWVWLFLIAILTAFSLATSNVGTAVRHRAKLLPMLLVLIPLMPFHTKIDDMIYAIESRFQKFIPPGFRNAWPAFTTSIDKYGRRLEIRWDPDDGEEHNLVASTGKNPRQYRREDIGRRRD